VGTATVMTVLGLGASVASRASGGCYAVCQQGERCNKNGLCEALPCRGQCLAGETCDEGIFGVKCHADASLAVSTSKAALAPPAPQTQVPDAAKP
jgi:hypothetical protein